MRWGLVLVCALAAFACAEPPCCEEDGDCAAGAVCFEGTCAAACVDDGGCQSGEVCVLPRRGTEGACAHPLRPDSVCPFDAPAPVGCDVPDPFEPNNDLEQAAPIPDFAELALCPAGDEDVFVLDLDRDEEFEIEIEFDGDAGDLDLQMIAENGDVLAESRGRGDRERVVAVTDEPARVFIRVFGFNDDQNTYVISASPLERACDDDEFEPNDAESPHEIPPVAEFEATLCEGDDVDRYVFDQPGNVEGRLFIEHDHPEDIIAIIGREGGNQAEASSGPGFAEMQFAIGGPGELFLEVRGVDERPVAYTVFLEIEGALPFECEDDEFEPNDDDDSATPIEIPAFLEATICEDDVDRYSFFADAGDSIRLRMEHNDPEGLFVRVRRVGGGSADANTGPGFATLNFSSQVSGELIIDVESFDGREVAYNLSLEFQDGPGPGPGGCGQDDNEPNNNPPNATVIDELPATVSGVVCGPDPDFFRVASFAQTGGVLTFANSPGVRFTIIDNSIGFTEDFVLGQNETRVVAMEASDEVFVVVTRQGPPRDYSFQAGPFE
jgi:hypothetical protein